MLAPKLIFSLVAFNPFASIPAVVLFSRQRESGQGNGKEGKGQEKVFCISVFLFSLLSKLVFNISLFNCIGFSNIGQTRLRFFWKIGIASALLLLQVCYAIERHFAEGSYKSLSPAKARPQSRLQQGSFEIINHFYDFYIIFHFYFTFLLTFSVPYDIF